MEQLRLTKLGAQIIEACELKNIINYEDLESCATAIKKSHSKLTGAGYLISKASLYLFQLEEEKPDSLKKAVGILKDNMNLQDKILGKEHTLREGMSSIIAMYLLKECIDKGYLEQNYFNILEEADKEKKEMKRKHKEIWRQ